MGKKKFYGKAQSERRCKNDENTMGKIIPRRGDVKTRNEKQ